MGEKKRIADAINLYKTKTTFEDACKYVGEIEAKECFDVIPYIISYFDFVALQSLDINISQNEISFDSLAMWAWIKEQINGRKT